MNMHNLTPKKDKKKNVNLFANVRWFACHLITFLCGNVRGGWCIVYFSIGDPMIVGLIKKKRGGGVVSQLREITSWCFSSSCLLRTMYVRH